MQYVSIDIETTGLNHHIHDIVEVGAVMDDLKVQKPLSELPKFHCYIVQDNYRVDPYCAFLHQAIFHRISRRNNAEMRTKYKFYTQEEFIPAFRAWLIESGAEKSSNGNVRITPAGKNFGSFDKLFLDSQFNFSNEFSVVHRQLDPAILYFDHLNDDVLPNQQTCLDRAGIEGTVEHTGLEDAIQVVQLLRHKFPLTS